MSQNPFRVQDCLKRCRFEEAALHFGCTGTVPAVAASLRVLYYNRIRLAGFLAWYRTPSAK